jgi:hypothetical protein
MPSQQDVPATADFLKAYRSEILALHNRDADVRSGSGYDIQNGVGAILWHRQAIRDRDAFRACYFDTCQGDDADALIVTRYTIPRILATQGTGTAALQRASAAGGSGTFYEGTRVSIQPTIPGPILTFEVAADTVVGALDTQARVPIRTLAAGLSQAVYATSSTNVLTLDDLTWDDSWRVTAIQCGPGTARENDDDYKARAKSQRQKQRRGYAQAIVDRLADVGASEVALFPSDWGGVDYGVNHCFVADSGFVTTPELLTECRIAVDGVRVLGPDLLVFGMTNTELSLDVAINVWSPEQTRAADYLVELAKAAVIDFFRARQNAFYWT